MCHSLEVALVEANAANAIHFLSIAAWALVRMGRAIRHAKGTWCPSVHHILARESIVKHRDQFQPQTVVVNIGGQSGTDGAGQKNGQLFFEAAMLDPHRIAVEEPIRWAAYINAAFPVFGTAARAFNVCEKTELLWKAADRAPRSHHKTLAERTDRDRLDIYMHTGSVQAGRWRA